MKLLSAIFDTVLIPVKMAEDVLNPFPMLLDGEDSKTRQQIEKVEEDIKE